MGRCLSCGAKTVPAWPDRKGETYRPGAAGPLFGGLFTGYTSIPCR